MDIDALIASSVFVGFIVLALLVADAATAWVDARQVRDDDEPEALTRRRVRELGWSVAVTAVLAVTAAFAVDSAARLVWDGDDPVAAAVLLLGVTVVAFGVGLAAVVAVVRRDRPSYARIRRDLRDRAIAALDEAELADFDERLARADRLRARRGQNALPLRVLGAGIVAALAVLLWFVAPLWLAICATVAAALAASAVVLAERADIVRQAALAVVLEAQRAEVVALLERARIPGRRQVPGLRDRVSRALAILREQQK